MQRWERTRGLPVHRLPGAGRGAVYALAAEVEVWRSRTRPDSEPEKAATGAVPRFRQISGFRAAVAMGAVALAAVLAFWHIRARVPPPERVRHLEQFTSSDGYDIAPSFSPDGNAVAYASDRAGSFQIYVRPLVAGGRELQITHDDRQNLEPAWCPDGRLIAYHGGGLEHGIFVLPALGGTPVRLTDFGSQAAWSPDGRWIVFRSTATYSDGLEALPPSAVSTLWMVPAEGGSPRQITSDGNPPGRHTSARFSPDGRRILFLAIPPGIGGPPGVWSIGVADRSPGQVSHGPLRIAGNPVYDHLGRGIYVVAQSPAAEMGIWRIPIDPRTHRAAGEPVEVVGLGTTRPGYLSLSRDGSRLAYTAIRKTNSLRSLPLAPETGLPRGPGTQITRETALRNVTPAFSPDGSRLAWTVQYQGQPWQIRLADADGANPAPLVTGLFTASAPNWTADGQSVLYFDPLQPLAILWSLRIADRMKSQLAEIPGLTGPPSLSPDGREVTYHRVTGKVLNIWKTRLAGGSPVQLTFDRESIGFPDWSPDGKWIVGQMRRGDDTHAVILPSGGGPMRQITAERGVTMRGGWSPDSRKVLFAGYRKGVWNLYWVAPFTGQAARLTDRRSPGGYVRSPVWSPRGDRVVYEEMDQRGNIFFLHLESPRAR